MFSFIHAADLHLDSPLLGLESKEGAPVERIRGATRTALSRLVDLCLKERVDFLLIAGDVYDGDWRDTSTGLFFNQQMRRLGAEGIRVYLISGNHDAASVITGELSLPENVHRFPVDGAETISHPTLPVDLHGQGFRQAAVTENLTPNYPPGSSNRFDIGLLHCSVGDVEGSRHATYAPCSIADLLGLSYDYWALGHIHKKNVLHEDPHIVYSGNPQGRHFNEDGPRGCYKIVVDERLEISSFEFEALHSVRWENLTFDISELDQITDLTQPFVNALSGVERDPHLLCLRTTVVGRTPLHSRIRKEPDQLRGVLQDAIDQSGIDCWLERVRLQTKPTVDLAELASQSAAARQIISALEGQPDVPLPADVTKVLKSLDQETSDYFSAEESNYESFVIDALQPEGDGDDED